MKKIISLILALLMCALTFVSCSDTGAETKDPSDNKEKVKLGVISMVENSAFTDMRDGIIEGLKEKGYVDGETATIDYQCAGGDQGTLSTIVSSMNDGTYDAVFCIATPTTASFVQLESETPCFFCAVSAPVESGVVSDIKDHADNITGTSNAIPVADIFALADKLTPDYKKVGIITSGKEPNATNTAAMAKSFLDGKNIEVYEVTSETSADVETAANAMADAGCDIVFIPNDSIVQSGITKLAEICNEKGIGTYSASLAMVASGCLATVAINDIEIGKLTAGMYDTYKKGTAVVDQPVIVCDAEYCTVSVNTAAKDALKIEVPSDVDVSYID